MNMFLVKHSLLYLYRCGFTQDRGTQLLLGDFFCAINLSFERNQVPCSLFLGVHKVFDSVCHHILLKFSKLGFQGFF